MIPNELEVLGQKGRFPLGKKTVVLFCRTEIERLKSLSKPVTVTVICIAIILSACSGNNAKSAIKVGNGVGGTNFVDFSGVDTFYSIPKSFPYEPPGTLYRLQTVGVSGGYVTLRVMYHSTDANGHDALVTGLVTYPTTRPKEGTWPVISWDHGTIGMSQTCAPSRMGLSGIAPNLEIKAVYVATDYLGLGIDGQIHPYLNRTIEADSTIDIVRAVRQIPDAHAGNTWVVVGDSQGGHAALSTGEVASKYAPELNLKGTVAIAPGVLLGQSFEGDNPELIDLIETMVIYGYKASNPGVNLDTVMTPALKSIATAVRTGCVDQIAVAFIKAYQQSGGKVFKTPPLKTQLGLQWLRENDIPQIRTQSPILIIGGGQDVIAVPARISALMPKLCKLKDTVSIGWYKDGNHGNELNLALQQVTNWIQDRLDNKPSKSDCPYTPPAWIS